MRVVEIDRGTLLEPCSLDLFNYQLDPYVGCAHHCVYCYTRNRAPIDWDTEVGVLRDLKQKLQTELEDLPTQTVYMGMNTDPYQPVEEELRQTRMVLDALERRGLSICILTKSDLVLRDADVIRRMPGSSVGFSVAFTNDGARRAFEENTIPLGARLETLAKLRDAGIETYALIDPVIPRITDVDSLVDRLAPIVDTVWIYPLHMASRDDPNWTATRGALKRRFPEALSEVERAAFDPEDEFWMRLRGDLEARAGILSTRLEIHI